MFRTHIIKVIDPINICIYIYHTLQLKSRDIIAAVLIICEKKYPCTSHFTTCAMMRNVGYVGRQYDFLANNLRCC